MVAISGRQPIHKLKKTVDPRNVIAHELGHVIGLGHNSDEAALMCGSTPWCHFTAPADDFLPLTSQEKRKLLEMYPPSWRPDTQGEDPTAR